MIRGGHVRDGRYAPGCWGTAMLDGDRYYRAFPDEKPTLSSLQALLAALARLEEEFRTYLEQSGQGDQADTGAAGPRQDCAEP